MSKPIIRKVFINKRNQQPVITLSKKEIKKTYPQIKFGQSLFVKLEIFNKDKKDNGT